MARKEGRENPSFDTPRNPLETWRRDEVAFGTRLTTIRSQKSCHSRKGRQPALQDKAKEDQIKEHHQGRTAASQRARQCEEFATEQREQHRKITTTSGWKT